MSFLNKLWKNPQDSVEKETKETKKNASKIPVTPIIPSTLPETKTAGGVKKQEIVDFFKEVMEKNNIPGPDYKEFFDALEKQKTSPKDERTKFNDLFIAFSTMGLTPQKLIDTANFYKTKYSEKKKGFDTEAQRAFDQSVGVKHQEVEKLEKENADIDAEMRRLNELKLRNEERARLLTEEIQNTTATLNTRRMDFQTTYDEIIKEIDYNISKITEYLINQQ